ncbi:RidA family protein [Muricoccus pecuniae]|uniref:Uncharacterized protein n=1 Tax=Muricoccus pecuniae TaxID=693023 RepID=A0A840YLP2_9PROT|nr:hypothetical protein [Roseomonas pecuniae]MBB5696072.1 hypothetical protein [Roseomonas pecuniae]
MDVTTFHTDLGKQFETGMVVRDWAIGALPYPNWTAVGVMLLAGFALRSKLSRASP